MKQHEGSHRAKFGSPWHCSLARLFFERSSIRPPLRCQSYGLFPRIHPAGHVSRLALLRKERGRGTDPMSRHELADGFASGGQHGIGNRREARFRPLSGFLHEAD
jgi:hypothetical protein